MTRVVDGKLGGSRRTWIIASSVSSLVTVTCLLVLIGLDVRRRRGGVSAMSRLLEDWMFPVSLCTLLSLTALVFFAACYNDTPPQPAAAALLKSANLS